MAYNYETRKLAIVSQEDAAVWVSRPAGPGPSRHSWRGGRKAAVDASVTAGATAAAAPLAPCCAPPWLAAARRGAALWLPRPDHACWLLPTALLRSATSTVMSWSL